MLSGDGSQSLSVEKIERKETKMETEIKTVEAEAKDEGKPVDSAAVEAEAVKEVVDVVALAHAHKQHVEQLSGQVAGLTKENEAIKGDLKEWTHKATSSESALSAMTAERDGLKSKVEELEKSRLAAVEELETVKKALSGAKPLSTADAEKEKRGSMWDDARKSKNKK